MNSIPLLALTIEHQFLEMAAWRIQILSRESITCGRLRRNSKG